MKNFFNNPALWLLIATLEFVFFFIVVWLLTRSEIAKEKRARLKYMLNHTTVKKIPATYGAPNVNDYIEQKKRENEPKTINIYFNKLSDIKFKEESEDIKEMGDKAVKLLLEMLKKLEK